MQIFVMIENCEGRDLIARTLVGDLMSSKDIGRAELTTANALEGDKGLIEQVGAVTVTLLSSGGAEFLFSALRSMYPKLTGTGLTDAAIRVRLEDTEIEISGPMSEAQFNANIDRAFSIVERRIIGGAT